MELSTTHVVKAPRSRVWDTLLNLEAIGACLPGAEGVKQVGDDRYEAELTAGVAPVCGRFKAAISLENRQPTTSYRLAVDATGRLGFVRGQALVTLSEEGAATHVHVAGTAEVGGTIARVGQRMLEGAARIMMDQFFACLTQRIEQPPAA